MSYASVGQLSGIEPWSRGVAETDEVYLWRGQLLGAEPRGLSDVQAIARAIGTSQNLGLDLRGIAYAASGPGTEHQLDAAFTSKLPRIMWLDPTFDTAEDIAKKLRNALVERFPTIEIRRPRFEEINDASPKHPALDFWRFHPVIYEAQFLDKMVPTDAFARFEGLYKGRAEDGRSLKPWPKDDPGGGLEPPPSQPSDKDSTLLWVAGGVVALWLASRALKQAGAAP